MTDIGAAERIRTFLYFLSRDHLPTGAIEEIMARVEQSHADGKLPAFSCPHVKALAEEWSERLGVKL